MAIDEQLATINAALDEAATEILAELELLRQHNLPPESQALLDSIGAKAEALRNVSPAVP